MAQRLVHLQAVSGTPLAPAVFSWQCVGHDEIEQYAVCPFLWAAAPWAPLATHPCSLAGFLLLSDSLPYSLEEVRLLAF